MSSPTCWTGSNGISLSLLSLFPPIVDVTGWGENAPLKVTLHPEGGVGVWAPCLWSSLTWATRAQLVKLLIKVMVSQHHPLHSHGVIFRARDGIVFPRGNVMKYTNPQSVMLSLFLGHVLLMLHLSSSEYGQLGLSPSFSSSTCVTSNSPQVEMRLRMWANTKLCWFSKGQYAECAPKMNSNDDNDGHDRSSHLSVLTLISTKRGPFGNPIDWRFCALWQTVIIIKITIVALTHLKKMTSFHYWRQAAKTTSSESDCFSTLISQHVCNINSERSSPSSDSGPFERPQVHVIRT